MLYLKLFETEEEKTACTDTYEYVSYTVESDKVNIHPETFFCKLTLNDGSIIEIEGSGELTNAMTIPYSATTVSAEIGNLCTSIGESAFVNMDSDVGFELLTIVDISNSVTSIGGGAFYNCTSLSSVTIGNSVTSIGDSAFANCSGLTSITIPNSVTNIGEWGTFSFCTSLTSVIIGNGVTSIGYNAFQDCTSLTSVTIGSGVTNIFDQAFENCTSLSSITIPSSVTDIGDIAFNHCDELSSITSLATTAPTITFISFSNVKRNGILYVPIGSSGYDVWMKDREQYLGYQDWTMVEQ